MSGVTLHAFYLDDCRRANASADLLSLILWMLEASTFPPSPSLLTKRLGQFSPPDFDALPRPADAPLLIIVSGVKRAHLSRATRVLGSCGAQIMECVYMCVCVCGAVWLCVCVCVHEAERD